MADSKKVILAVDDMVTVLNMIRKALEPGYELCLAKTVDAAWKALAANSVDMVLLDTELPEMSGFDFLSAARKNHGCRDIPAIFVTSHATKDIIAQARMMGARDFIVKPITPDRLLARVNEAFKTGDQKINEAFLGKELLALQGACKKGDTGTIASLAGQLQFMHFNMIVDAHIAEICGMIAQQNYSLAGEKIHILLDNRFYEHEESI
ncbi:MAG: response regulator [Spirochaetaceae bacterium]|jgi:DNA-binding response OmpR family regulator|nr:response regulator [Spirochaetaceae bacterium]